MISEDNETSVPKSNVTQVLKPAIIRSRPLLSEDNVDREHDLATEGAITKKRKRSQLRLTLSKWVKTDGGTQAARPPTPYPNAPEDRASTFVGQSCDRSNDLYTEIGLSPNTGDSVTPLDSIDVQISRIAEDISALTRSIMAFLSNPRSSLSAQISHTDRRGQQIVLKLKTLRDQLAREGTAQEDITHESLIASTD